MNFTFDGNIYENNNSSKDFKSDQKFNFSGLIYESNIRTAKTPLPFEADVRKFLALNPIERTNYLIDVLGKRSQSEREEFTKTWSILDKKSSDSSLDPEKKEKKGLDQTLDAIQGIAAKPAGVEELSKTLECRFYVIQRLKSQIDTQKIGQYFTVLASKLNITEDKICAILNRGADIANASGAKVEDVLDFVVAGYERIRSFAILDQLLTRAQQVAENNRTVPVFKLLLKAISGQKANTRAYLMTIKDPQQMIIFNELMTMAQAGPVENMEQARRLYQASLDKMTKQTEIYYRRIKVYNMFKAEVSNYGLAHVMQQLGSLFKLFQKTGFLDIITNIYYDMRAGELARQALLTPITRDPAPTAQNQSDSFNSFSSGFRTPLVGHSGAKFVKIAQARQPSFTQSALQQNVNYTSPSGLFKDIVAGLQSIIVLLKANPDPEIASKLAIFVPVVQGVINIFNNFNDNTTLDDVIKSLSNFQNSVKISENLNESYIKTSQSDENSNIRLAAGPLAGGLAAIFQAWLANELTLLANDPAYAAKWILTLINFVISIVRTYGSMFWGKTLQRDPMFFDAQGKFLKNSPAAIAYTQTLTEAGYSNDQINAMITFKQTRAIVKEKVKNYETKIKNVLEISVQTGANSTTEVPLKNTDNIKKIYTGFILELRGAIVQFDKELDFLRNIASEGQMQQTNQLAFNLITQHLREAEADLQDMKNLLGRYYSFDMIIQNVLKKMRLAKILKPLMSKITKFKTIGISTAALISDPQGIMPILNKIRQMELDNIYKMKVDLTAKKRQLPQNTYI
jgi:hypothetical protein